MTAKVVDIGFLTAKTAVIGFGCKNTQVRQRQKRTNSFEFVGLLRQTDVFAANHVDRFQPSVAPE
jgi:hypothetical protein